MKPHLGAIVRASNGLVGTLEWVCQHKTLNHLKAFISVDGVWREVNYYDLTVITPRSERIGVVTMRLNGHHGDAGWCVAPVHHAEFVRDPIRIQDVA